MLDRTSDEYLWTIHIARSSSFSVGRLTGGDLNELWETFEMSNWIILLPIVHQCIHIDLSIDRTDQCSINAVRGENNYDNKRVEMKKDDQP